MQTSSCQPQLQKGMSSSGFDSLDNLIGAFPDQVVGIESQSSLPLFPDDGRQVPLKIYQWHTVWVTVLLSLSQNETYSHLCKLSSSVCASMQLDASGHFIFLTFAFGIFCSRNSGWYSMSCHKTSGFGSKAELWSSRSLSSCNNTVCPSCHHYHLVFSLFSAGHYSPVQASPLPLDLTSLSSL